MNIELIDGWKRLWKSFTIQLAAAGIFLPDLLQVVADNSDLIPFWDDGYKSGVRLACLIAIVLLRPVKQASLAPKE
ncbi:DUF7940 domain-containing protein [Variovorax saccharolyticus]|uniref:DUF7940 domain-containing protein n=1 Tax=Variovorax saccharolyticus TaxID=3053516 RepID=UPI002574F8A8|nr:hypothetical protein [Variovorax sp. J31P216]MDM0024064.1 hypothetical protein [Variovorax sp. J31P216]